MAVVEPLVTESTASKDHLDDREAASPSEAATVDDARRSFLLKAAAAAVGALALAWNRVDPALAAPPGSEHAPPRPLGPGESVPPLAISPQADEDVLVRMQRDLARALAKPPTARRWGMVIDTRKCVACMACTVACVMENKLPPGVVYRPVIDTEVGRYPHVTRKFLPRPCMQCDNPPCVPVCPVNATFKRPDGIVEIDYDACIGCRYCLTACPYQARTFDFGERWTERAASGRPAALALDAGGAYEELPSFEYGEEWRRSEGVIPASPVGNARKCHFCAHRLAEGLLPMCVTTCIGRATFFGDLDDPESLVAELAASPNAVRLKEELGTEPKVYYLL
jgi:molybdopterin-containing oxidoreductase family iron-sulfur binding subunit